MNKQELKERVSSLPSELVFKKVMVNKDSVLGLIDQLDELRAPRVDGGS